MGLRGIGSTKAEAFEQIAIAMTAAITDPGRIALTTALEIHCEAPDDELLLVDWLNALVYEMSTRRMLFGQFRVTIEGSKLDAEVRGEVANPGKHHPAVEVKGATYTALDVGLDRRGRWYAQCVIDV